MVFSPCFSEVIPVTVVTSFPRRLVITVVIDKLAGNVSRAAEAERAPEERQGLQHEGSSSGHKQQDTSRGNSRGFFFQRWVPAASHFSWESHEDLCVFCYIHLKVHPLAWWLPTLLSFRWAAKMCSQGAKNGIGKIHENPEFSWACNFSFSNCWSTIKIKEVFLLMADHGALLWGQRRKWGFSGVEKFFSHATYTR